ncbi:MAG: pilin [Patescibacteria group bacterium]|nr:pilin [Patescibacteria group bacterium]MDD5554243.1 pilin [Patescibacteria group bacterium]
MKITKIKKHLLAASLLSLLILPQLALVQFSSPSPAQAAESNLWKNQTGAQIIGGQAFGDETPRDVREITVLVIKVFLGFLGLIFLVLIISAGFKYMTAAGNEEKITEAMSQIKTGVIGLIIIMASYAITSYLTTCVFNITKPGSTVWMCHKDFNN